jgi:hypothetical protein
MGQTNDGLSGDEIAKEWSQLCSDPEKDFPTATFIPPLPACTESLQEVECNMQYTFYELCNMVVSTMAL